MKKSVLKRTLSIVLACIMMMSIFAALPIQAGATPAGRRDIAASCNFSVASSVTYTGYKVVPKHTIKDWYLGKTLKEGTDYTTTTTSINAGTGRKVTFTGKGTYYGSKTYTFTISRRSVTQCSVSMATETPYTGALQFPKPVVKYNGKTLKEYVDYTLSNANNKGPGTASVTIVGIGNFCSAKTVKYTIYKRVNASNFTVSTISTRYYNGSTHKPEPVVKYNGKTLKKDTDYTISYTNNKYPTSKKYQPSLTIKGIGKYEGSKKVNFKIAVKTPSPNYCERIDRDSIKVKWNNCYATYSVRRQLDSGSWVVKKTGITSCAYTDTSARASNSAVYTPTYRYQVMASVKNPYTGETTYSSWSGSVFEH